MAPGPHLRTAAGRPRRTVPPPQVGPDHTRGDGRRDVGSASMTGESSSTGSGPAVPLATAQGRWIVAATVLGSGVVGIDATVVNIALPAIGRSLGASFASLQWVVTAYAL